MIARWILQSLFDYYVSQGANHVIEEYPYWQAKAEKVARFAESINIYLE